MGAPARLASTARIIATRAESRPLVARRGVGISLLATSACTSAISGRRPSRVTVTQVPGTVRRAAGQEQPAGVGQPDDADVGQVEAADLVGRAVAVLHRADQAQPGVPVALELHDDVDEVLEHPRPGDRAVLGDVPDEQGGDAARLGHLDQRGGDLADLA